MTLKACLPSVKLEHTPVLNVFVKIKHPRTTVLPIVVGGRDTSGLPEPQKRFVDGIRNTNLLDGTGLPYPLGYTRHVPRESATRQNLKHT